MCHPHRDLAPWPYSAKSSQPRDVLPPHLLVTWGIATIPAAWLPRLMPWAIAAELLLMAERIDAQRAYQVGLVNKVVATDQLMAQAKRICELSPVAV